MKKLAIASALVVALTSAQQVEAADFSLLLMGPSYHTIQKNLYGQTFNNSTFGLGGSWSLNPQNQVEVGAFRNSFSHIATFIEYDYLPVHLGRTSIGVGLGLVTGYQHQVGGGAITPTAGVLVQYAATGGVAWQMRILPLYNGHTMAQSTRWGAVVNFGVTVKIGRLEREGNESAGSEIARMGF